MWFGFTNLELSAPLLVVQGQPKWEELLLLKIVHNLHHGGQLDTWLVNFLGDLKNHVLPPNPLLSCPGLSVDSVVIGVLHCLDLGVTQ